MIQLYKYIKESLLDDEDVLMKDSDHDALIYNLTHNKDNIFNSSYNIKAEIGKALPSYEVKDNMLSIYTKKPMIILSTPKSDFLSEYLGNYDIDKIYCRKIELDWRDELDDKNLIKNVISNRLILNTRSVKNMDFKLVDKLWIDKHANMIGDSYRATNPLIKFINTNNIQDVNIQFSSGNRNINIQNHKLPKIYNVKSNAFNINYYSPSLLDDKIFDKLIDPGFEYEYWDDKKNDWKTIRINTFKKAIAIVNNPKKYEDPSYNPERKSIINIPGSYKNYYFEYPPFKNDISVEELFPFVKDMLALINITLRNNYVCLRFSTDGFYDCMKGHPIKDGWYMYLYSIK